MKKISVMFICMGNICRSPMAEAVFRNMVANKGLSEHFNIASSATGRWHLGQSPHIGTRLVLSEHDIEVGDKRSQLLKKEDFEDYDYLVAMDMENVEDIQYSFKKKVKRLLEFAEPGYTMDVPDPYYNQKFNEVFDLVTKGCEGLLNHIIETEGL